MTSQAHVFLQPGHACLHDRLRAADPVPSVRVAPSHSVILRDSPLWILDEPTSAIDAEAEAEVLDELRMLAGQHITIFVSHRAWTLRSADRIYVMDDGRIVESGTYDELMRGGGRFRELFATQPEG